MTTASLEQKVRDFLSQKRIAIAGVSGDPGRHPIGNSIYRRLRDAGHEVFAVNPHLKTFEGAPCYPDLKSLPGEVDAVMIVTRPAVTEQLVRDCVEVGVRRIWMHSSGRKGSSVSPEAVDFCNQNGVMVIAGSCPMMFGSDVDFGHKCIKLMLKLSHGLPA